MVCGVPCMCMMITPARDAVATSIMCGSLRSPDMSLMISAPASRATCAIAAFVVSIEIGRRGRSARRARIKGIVRACSSGRSTGVAPGLEDSPPMSIIVAPASASARAWVNAASSVGRFPPSEKESGVVFTIPMIAVVSPSGIILSPQTHDRIRPLVVGFLSSRPIPQL